ncbi:MAG: HD domain-containing protein [Planctomycetaceae bacterium]|nr:HD domain-containing protein [Planctomycetaceae bacterium]MCL2305825.1 HD domain-containing protein [Planctomycetaceae bacterium]
MGKTFDFIRRDMRFSFIVLMLLMNLLICFLIEAWKPPFSHRLNDVPKRPIICQTPFRVEDPEATKNLQERARLSALPVYALDATALIPIRDSLINTVTGLLQKQNFDEASSLNLWSGFFPKTSESSPEKTEIQSRVFFETLKEECRGTPFQEKLKRALAPFEQGGFLHETPPQTSQRFSRGLLIVLTPTGKNEFYINEVLLGEGQRLKHLLDDEFSSREVVQPLFDWLFPKIRALPDTLTLDLAKTDQEIEKAVAAVEPVYIDYLRDHTIVSAGKVITPRTLELLRLEYQNEVAEQPFAQKFTRFSSVFLLLIAAHFLGWVFAYRRERRKPKFFFSGVGLTVFFLAAVSVAKFLIVISREQGHLGLIPLLIFAQSAAIMFSWELSLVLSLNLALVLVFAEGTRLATMLVLFGTTVVMIEQLGRLHSRRKLVVVGFISGLVCFVITLAAGILEGRLIETGLLTEALLNGLWTLLAGVAMTGLLPFIERSFGILTDMSLLELGDVSHPLLQEMLRRAPATYSHSFQVGSIAEAAAEAIGARSLLTRVGAYFHDIGKILKPHFFAENQIAGENIHDTLEPRMSALVIVAHIKDGADLARQHHLPQPLVDLIEQHHGTSLVSYFYEMAVRQNKDNPNNQVVDESTFRYPGPKPRSKEAGILMLADASESGVRAMGDAANPGRIENMVRMITKTKLEDGQFDECGLTLQELRTVENSIINSLVAIRHHRIKYPGQEKLMASPPRTDAQPKTETFSPTSLKTVLKTDSTVVADSNKIIRKE